MRDPNLPAYQTPNSSSTLALRLRLAESSLQSTSGRARQPTRSAPTQNMSDLRHLPKTAAIVLFTPVLTPAVTASIKSSTKKQSSSAMDPFETLGRSLASHHPRIRHVPYVPNIGFTATHAAFLNQADAVIVVLCEPHAFKRESSGLQYAFAEQTLETTDGPPPILVQCGDIEGKGWEDVLASFEIVLKCGRLTEEIAKQISKKLFGSATRK